MRKIKFRLILEGKIVGYEKHGLAYHNGKKQIIAMHSSDNEEWWNTVHDPTKWIQHDDKEMDEWISIEDELPPKDGKNFIIANFRNIPNWQAVAWWHPVYKSFMYTGGNSLLAHHQTHWMPLPEPHD